MSVTTPIKRCRSPAVFVALNVVAATLVLSRATESWQPIWGAPVYSLGEKIRALRAIEVTQKRVLPALQGLDLLAAPLRIAPPVAIFQGRHDAAAPPALGERLAVALGALLVWFDDSAHLPHEEEPARFREELIRFTSA